MNLSPDAIRDLIAQQSMSFDDMSDEEMMGVDIDGKQKEYTC
jgi:hypothetical protein